MLPKSHSLQHLLAVATLSTVAIVFGLTFLATKVALCDVYPFTPALFRFLTASVILLPALWLSMRGSSERKILPWPQLIVVGLTGVTLFYVFQKFGLETIRPVHFIGGALVLLGIYLAER